jgi:hypothetical protein
MVVSSMTSEIWGWNAESFPWERGQRFPEGKVEARGNIAEAEPSRGLPTALPASLPVNENDIISGMVTFLPTTRSTAT